MDLTDEEYEKLKELFILKCDNLENKIDEILDKTNEKLDKINEKLWIDMNMLNK